MKGSGPTLSWSQIQQDLSGYLSEYQHSCVSLFVCSASGYAKWKTENVEEEDDDKEEVFTVELHRGPHGLGLALVDGTVRQPFFYPAYLYFIT